MTMTIELQRARVAHSDKWEKVTSFAYLETLEALKKNREKAKEKAKELEEKNPNYYYRVRVISSEPYMTEGV